MSISFIIPVYNTEPFIELTINSILNQQIADIEVIVVDDCSTDASLKVIRNLASSDDRVKVVALKENTPGGAGVPSNIGLDYVTKDYVAFVDSDDWVHQKYFENLFQEILKNDCDIAIGSYTNVDTITHVRGLPYDTDIWSRVVQDEVSVVNAKELLIFSPEPWRKIYKSKLFQSPEIRFPDLGIVNEDYPFHWYCCNEAKNAVIVNDARYYHRINRSGQTTEKSEKQHFTIITNTNAIIDFLEKHGTAKEWSYLQYWLIRNFWTFDVNRRPEVTQEYFCEFQKLLHRIPNSKKLTDIPIKYSNWPNVCSYIIALSGSYDEYQQFRREYFTFSKQKIATTFIKKFGLISFLKRIRTKHNIAN